MKISSYALEKSALLVGALICALSLAVPAQVDIVTLKNSNVEIKITPDLGGRVVGFSIPGKPNVLMINQDELAKPIKDFSPETGFIEYFGHINWVSPQREWWVRQSWNPERAKQRAMWPPDPFLIYGRTRITESHENSLALTGPYSDVSGIRFDKTFDLVKDRWDSVDLHVTATNITNADVSWGIWFNTRVNPFAHVFVPVKADGDVRIENYNAQTNIPANFSVKDGFFTFEHGALPSAEKNVRSKAFIQPARGWMAAFTQGQVFIIQFPLQAREAIHPEQGQVEIYHAVDRGQINGGMLEMELHAPYLTLKPGQQMAARERWTVLPYEGGDTRAAQLTFLQKLAKTKIIGNF